MPLQAGGRCRYRTLTDPPEGRLGTVIKVYDDPELGPLPIYKVRPDDPGRHDLHLAEHPRWGVRPIVPGEP